MDPLRRLVFLALLASGATDAGAAYNASKVTFTSGAAGLTGGSYRVGTTVAEAGPVGRTAGGSFDVISGFWFPGLGIATSVPIPTVEPGAGTEPLRFENHLAGGLPNPFHDVAHIAFSVAASAPVTLVVFDVRGRRVTTLADGVLPAGRHEAVWDGHDDAGGTVPSGIYFIRLTVGSWSSEGRLLRIR